MEWLTGYWAQIASGIAGLIGGSLLTLTFQSVRNRNHIEVRHGSMVDQTGARAGGDVVGHNKTTTTTSRN